MSSYESHIFTYRRYTAIKYMFRNFPDMDDHAVTASTKSFMKNSSRLQVSLNVSMMTS